jgi:UDP-glucose 4-epimerase
LENISSLVQRDLIRFVHGTILDLDLLYELSSGTDYIFHYAAIPSVPVSFEQPCKVNEANITGTLNVLLAARQNKIKKVIFSSSSSVYGDSQESPKVESTAPNPQSPYAVTKLTGEYYCNLFTQYFDLPTICLRYFNVFGPGQDANSQYASVVPRIITAVRSNQSPVVYGDGDQTRDFVYVKDAVRAAILASESNETGMFNIGSGRSTSINTLAETILRLMSSKLVTKHEPERAGDVRHSLASIVLARSIGYVPQFSIEQGLIETIGAIRR